MAHFFVDIHSNKAYHVYTALVKRRRQYYCSYSCYKQRPNPKEKR